MVNFSKMTPSNRKCCYSNKSEALLVLFHQSRVASSDMRVLCWRHRRRPNPINTSLDARYFIILEERHLQTTTSRTYQRKVLILRLFLLLPSLTDFIMVALQFSVLISGNFYVLTKRTLYSVFILFWLHHRLSFFLFSCDWAKNVRFMDFIQFLLHKNSLIYEFRLIHNPA